MAQLALDQSQAQTESLPRISVEVLVVTIVLLLALTLRVVQLGALPLGNAEAHEALAALHRVDPSLPTGEGSTAIFPVNALGALVNMVSFTLFNESDMAARLPTALAGVLLSLSPLLFRRQIGKTAALLVAVGITISPVSLLASRSMSGMVWALLLVMLGGWFTLRFVESRQKGFALAATICGAGVLLLTTPFGLLILLGVFFGMAWGVIGSDPEDPIRKTVPEIAAVWSGFEALLAAGVAVAVVATGFFTVPNGFSALAEVVETFFRGLSERPLNTPFAYGFLVSLRYDFTYLLFGMFGVWLAWRDSTFLERFFTGWLIWGILSGIFYGGATSDYALINTIPAVGLTVSFVLRLLASTSYGFWNIPRWLLPLHMLVVAGLLVSMGVNLENIFFKILEEAKPVPFAKNLEISPVNGNNVHISTLYPDGSSSGMSVIMPYVELKNCDKDTAGRDVTNLRQDSEGRFCEFEETTTLTVQVVPLDENAKAANFSITDPNNNEAHPTQRLGDELLFTVDAPASTIYTMVLTLADGQTLDRPVQYMVLVFPGDIIHRSGLKKYTSNTLFLHVPNLQAYFLIGSRVPNRVAIIVVMMMLLIIPITFFISGAFFGSRAAWRGIAFGFLVYMALYGVGLAWDASRLHGGDIRELWFSEAVPEDYHSLQATLKEYSRRDNGMFYDLHLTVEGRADSALGWALRNYPNAKFVNQLNPDTTTPVIIASDIQPQPRVATSYVGKALVLDQAWKRGSLNWTDFGSWLLSRRTRFQPEVQNPYRLWVQQDLYDVVNIPEE